MLRMSTTTAYVSHHRALLSLRLSSPPLSLSLSVCVRIQPVTSLPVRLPVTKPSPLHTSFLPSFSLPFFSHISLQLSPRLLLLSLFAASITISALQKPHTCFSRSNSFTTAFKCLQAPVPGSESTTWIILLKSLLVKMNYTVIRYNYGNNSLQACCFHVSCMMTKVIFRKTLF